MSEKSHSPQNFDFLGGDGPPSVKFPKNSKNFQVGKIIAKTKKNNKATNFPVWELSEMGKFIERFFVIATKLFVKNRSCW